MSKLLRSFLLMSAMLVLSMTLVHLIGHEAFAQFGVNRNIVPGEIVTATGGEDSLIDLVRTILNYFLGFLGIITLAIIIYGGFMYVTAGVNEAGADTGKKILTYAAIGIIVILLSFVIVNTLLQAAVPGATQ
jgi:ethanolamine utilization microcompartment shell protein EutS